MSLDRFRRPPITPHRDAARRRADATPTIGDDGGCRGADAIAPIYATIELAPTRRRHDTFIFAIYAATPKSAFCQDILPPRRLRPPIYDGHRYRLRRCELAPANVRAAPRAHLPMQLTIMLPLPTVVAFCVIGACRRCRRLARNTALSRDRQRGRFDTSLEHYHA